MIWLIFIIIVLSLTYCGSLKNNKFYWVYRLLLLIVLSLLTGLGSPVGQDHEAYLDMFNEYTELSDMTDITKILSSYAIEPGYILLNVIANILHFSEPFFFVFLSILMNLGVVYVVYHFRNPVLAILVFVLTINYVQEINLVRQCIAISIYIIAIMKLKNREFKLYYILLFVSFLFHSTIVALIPFSILGYLNFDKYKILIFNTSLFLWIFSILVFMRMVNIPYLDTILQLFGDTRYSSYSSGSNDMGLDNVGFNFVYNFVFIFVLFSMKTEVNIIKVWILIGVIFLNFNLPTTTRIALYFIIFIPLTCGEYLVIKTYAKTPGIMRWIPIYRNVFVLYWIYRLMFSNILGNPLLGSGFYSI